MKKISTKVKRVAVLSAMMIFMTCTTVFAQIDYRLYMNTELTVTRASGLKKCVAQTIPKKTSYPFSYLDVTITYNDGSDYCCSRINSGVGIAAYYSCGYEDIDCVDTYHCVKNTNNEIGDENNMSSN